MKSLYIKIIRILLIHDFPFLKLFWVSTCFSFVIPAYFQGLAAAYCLRVMPRMAQVFSGGDSGVAIGLLTLARCGYAFALETTRSSTFARSSIFTGLAR